MSEVLENKSKKKSGLSKAEGKIKKVNNSKSETQTQKISTNKVSTNKTKQDSKTNSNGKNENDKSKKVENKQKTESTSIKKQHKKSNTNQKNRTIKKENEKIEPNNLPASESKFDKVSLKEIKEALQNKVNDNQKQKVVKKVLINIGFAITAIVYLIIVALATKNIELLVLEKDLKIITLGILVLGIGVLERAYKKDNTQMAINAVEILIFGAINLCMMYAIKINFIKLGDFEDIINNITYIGGTVAVYYIIKSIIISVKNVKKFKKENNDIKEIIKK